MDRTVHGLRLSNLLITDKKATKRGEYQLVKELGINGFKVVVRSYRDISDACQLSLVNSSYDVLYSMNNVPNCHVSQKRWEEMDDDIASFVFKSVTTILDTIDGFNSYNGAPPVKRSKISDFNERLEQIVDLEIKLDRDDSIQRDLTKAEMDELISLL